MKKTTQSLIAASLVVMFGQTASASVPAPIPPKPTQASQAADKAADPNKPKSNNASRPAATMPPPPPIIVPRAKMPPDVVPPAALARDVGEAITSYQSGSVLQKDQINEIKTTVQDARLEQSYPYPRGYVPKPVNRRLEVPMDIPDEPPMLNTLMGMLTTLVFVDNEGTAWPIADVSFDKNSFSSPDVSNKPSTPTNVFRIQPEKPYGYGNVSIILQGRETSPITMMIQIAQGNTVDNRIDLKVEGKNPAAKVRPSAQNLNAVKYDPYIDQFLYGQIPVGAKPLYAGSDPQKIAWLFNGAIYLRTANDLITPAYTAIGGASTGVRVYRIPNVRTILWSANGKPQTITLNDAPGSAK